MEKNMGSYNDGKSNGHEKKGRVIQGVYRDTWGKGRKMEAII